jgi:hypothetical protein
MAIHRDNERIMLDKNENDFTLINTDMSEITLISKLIELQGNDNDTQIVTTTAIRKRRLKSETLTLSKQWPLISKEIFHFSIESFKFSWMTSSTVRSLKRTKSKYNQI